MTDNEIEFLPYESALKIVAAIQEEEDIERRDKRILTVYNHEDNEVCWFDYEDVIEAVKKEGKEANKENVQEYILRHIPDWAGSI